MSQASPHSRRFPAELAWLPIVALALAAIYLPGLGNSLVFDDASLTGTLFEQYAALLPLKVRTLSYGSFVWVQALLGEGWWKQRLVNLLIHASWSGRCGRSTARSCATLPRPRATASPRRTTARPRWASRWASSR